MGHLILFTPKPIMSLRRIYHKSTTERSPTLSSESVRRMRNFLIPVIILMFAGCAGLSGKNFTIDTVGGDLLITDLASGSQEADNSSTVVDVSTSSLSELPSVVAGGNGLLGVSNISIRYVSGSVIIERALVGTQGVDIPKALETLYLPGDPFRYPDE